MKVYLLNVNSIFKETIDILLYQKIPNDTKAVKTRIIRQVLFL